MSVENPATLGGTPQTMSSNNWWDDIGAAVGDGVDAANSLTRNYVQLLVAKRDLASANTPTGNRPPGSFGLNPQASSVPGAQPQYGYASVLGNLNSTYIVLAVAICGVILLLVKK